MKALVWEEGMGEQWESTDIPADLMEEAEHWRHQLVDVVSHYDDVVLEKYLATRRSPPRTCAGRSAPAPSPTSWCPCCAARPSRTRACSPCSTP